tara:strand:- start:341 stop:1684 length:1344 start_codon:yes stop_codon:yes gene_type:complete
MQEGNLDAPVRHPIDWNNPDFWDESKLEAELERAFDICHGCRRCFNLCDSFPRLFDLVDESSTGEVDGVAKDDYKSVVDACTLCDLCFMVKCPYVPPHEFNLDFPHLMLRHRAVELKKSGQPFMEKQVKETDRNGKLGGAVAGLTNWATDRKNNLTRPVMESVAGIDRNADLPQCTGRTLVGRAKSNPPQVNKDAPGYGRKAVLYATCFSNYNNPEIGEAALNVMAKNGVETEVVYPRCCGMPQLESGDIERVAEHAKSVLKELLPYVEKGYDIVAPIPSCALMMKFEWPLILPDDEDIAKLSKATFDITEFVVDLNKKNGLADGLQPLDGGVTMHISCHSRAQNMGAKATEMLRLIPEADLAVIERCSGHGGAWGVMKDNFETALKIGKPVARTALKNNKKYVASECPLAGAHILQGMEAIRKEDDPEVPEKSVHPIQIFARAYGL